MGVDPFEDLFPVTLRCEGTTRGTGGIRLAGDDGATGVPGLYAAGDAASREVLAGAVTGGGGPNASWAVASGAWAGRGAAAFALRRGPRAVSARAVPLGSAGLRPAAAAKVDVTAAGPPGRARRDAPARQELLPYRAAACAAPRQARRGLAGVRDHCSRESVGGPPGARGGGR